jgi:hypothetical protein
MTEVNGKTFFLDVMQLIRNRCSREEYTIISKMIEGLYYGDTYNYVTGYDPNFFHDIERIKNLPKREIKIKIIEKNNVIKFKPRTSSK